MIPLGCPVEPEEYCSIKIESSVALYRSTKSNWEFFYGNIKEMQFKTFTQLVCERCRNESRK